MTNLLYAVAEFLDLSSFKETALVRVRGRRHIMESSWRSGVLIAGFQVHGTATHNLTSST